MSDNTKLPWWIDTMLSIGFGIPCSMLGGLVLSDLWRWFVSPVFHVTEVTARQGVGINLLFTWASIGAIFAVTTWSQKTSELPGIARILGYTAAYLMLWGVGALWHTFYVF